MTPRYALAVDPVFLHVLGLIDRIDAGSQPAPQDERVRIGALLDQAEAITGAGRDWELGKYALVSWVDELLVDTPWPGREWWSNHVLEVDLFNTRLCNEQFYIRAQEATTLPNRDALEVYYICVVLGFRGLYREPSMAEALAQAHGLPPDLESWARQTSMAIRLGQGRPALPAPEREVHGAPPLQTRSLVVWSWLAVIILIACNVLFFYYGIYLADS